MFVGENVEQECWMKVTCTCALQLAFVGTLVNA
jgi:hypothetical protein